VEETDDDKVAPKKRGNAKAQMKNEGKVKVEQQTNFEKGSNQAAKKSFDTVPPALSFDCGDKDVEQMHGRVGATYEKAWGYREPFILWNNERVRSFFDKEEVQTAAQDFVEMFATSPLRATESRVHVPLLDDLGRDFALELEP
jgi:hypothetical protein